MSILVSLTTCTDRGMQLTPNDHSLPSCHGRGFWLRGYKVCVVDGMKEERLDSWTMEYALIVIIFGLIKEYTFLLVMPTGFFFLGAVFVLKASSQLFCIFIKKIVHF